MAYSLVCAPFLRCIPTIIYLQHSGVVNIDHKACTFGVYGKEAE